ncbi:cytochrome P450 CYP12A2-like [Bicyclus anynana]|uniref:Cytochrome P450 CYP12A2-like n=1 Tax=Bicyclus anynana TaxID=110368 RepID=A0ABM3LFU1_BICAN|nr:cytochrome P450 CYP12A2-like [Bicyclus anynana]
MYKLKRFFITRNALNRQKYISAVIKEVEDRIKPWRKIPGPLSLPIIGQLLHFLPGGWLYKRTIELQELLYKSYGPIVRLDGNLGFPPITFIFDPEAAIKLFRKEDPLPVRPGFDCLVYYRKHFYNKHEDDPNGVILDHGETWKKLRSLMNPAMLRTKAIKPFASVLAEVADDMVDRLRSKRNKQNMIEDNLFTELNLWALESVGAVTLGDRLNCLDPNLPDDSPAKKLIDALHESLRILDKLDFQPSLWKYITTPSYKKGMEIFNVLLRVNKFFIERSIQNLKSKEETNDENKWIIEKILELDRNVAVTLANDLFLAGVDTSAGTALAILYLLAANPDKQNKLREEVMSKHTRTYLKACIKEALRLYPIVGGNFRKTTKEHDVLGYRIPKNMIVIIGNQYLCSVEDQFPQPTQFLPERWIVERNDPLYYGNAHPFAYAPFRFGVRSCVGRRIAELEIEILISKIVENFKLDWIGPPPKRTRRSTINYILEPYNFVFNDI